MNFPVLYRIAISLFWGFAFVFTLYADLDPDARTGRFVRGEDIVASFVTPLSQQKGVVLSNFGDPTLEPGEEMPWVYRVQRDTRYHGQLTGGTNFNYRVTYNNPIVGFGDQAGGTSLWVGRHYTWSFHAGYRNESSLPNGPDIRIRVYQKSSFTGGATNQVPLDTIEITVPRKGSAAWQGFVQDGFLQIEEQYDLETRIKLIEAPVSVIAIEDSSAGDPTNVSTAYQLTHIASSDNYYYIVEANGDVNSSTPFGLTVGSPATFTPKLPTILYSMDFTERPPFYSTALDTPQFEAAVLPDAYQGKSVKEITEGGGIQNFTFSLTPAASHLLVDNSPELRSHPILDNFVADMENDPIALVNYVSNHIDITDMLNYNADGSITENSVNEGGVIRSALAVFQEEQGSPSEVCALTVYLLRKAGYHAVYVYPEDGEMKMIDRRVSDILGFQVQGAVDAAGNPEEPVEPGDPSLIAVNYPWVAVSVDDPDNPGMKKWVHIYPWLKDREIKEGYDLYQYMPQGYENGLKWVQKYILNDPAIVGLGNPGDTPAELFPEFVRNELETNYPDISLDDIGITSRIRQHYVTDWEDFPRPFKVEGTPTVVEKLDDFPAIDGIAGIFDTVEISVASEQNPGKSFTTGEIRLLDLHNRQLLLYCEKTGVNQHDMILAMAPYHEGISGSQAFPVGSSLTQKQELIQALDSSDSTIEITAEINRHRRVTLPGGTPPDPNEMFLGLAISSLSETVTDSVDKGDMVSVIVQPGDVTPRMLAVHAEAIWEMEREYRDTPGYVAEAELAQGTTLYLMAQSYYERVSRFGGISEDLHKAQTVSQLYFSTTRWDADLINDGDIDLRRPVVNVRGINAIYAAHKSVHADTVIPNETNRLSDFQVLQGFDGSAQEHAVINHFLEKEDAVSAMRLLQLAEAQGIGIVELREDNWQAEGNTTYGADLLKNHDPSLWAIVEDTFTAPGAHDYHFAYITASPVTSGTYTGMGLYRSGSSLGYIISGVSQPINGGDGGELPEDALDLLFADQINVFLNLDGSYSLVFNDDSGTGSISVDATRFGYRMASTQDFDALYTGLLGQPGTSLYGNSYLSQGSLLGLSPSADAQTVFQTVNDQGGFSVTNFIGQMASLVSDPVHVVTGAFYIDEVDLRLNGPFPLEMRRNYNSQNLSANEFGHGWKFNYMPYLAVAVDESVIYAAEMDGSVIAFRQDTADTDLWVPSPDDNAHLVNQEGGQMGSLANPFNSKIERTTPGSDTVFTHYAADGSVRTYRVQSFPVGSNITRQRPYLEKWQDAQGNFHSFTYGTTYGQTNYGKVKKIKSSNGNFLGFYYNTYGQITEAYTGDGRRIFYDYDDFGDLTKVTRPDASEVRYTYEHETATIDGQNVEVSNHLIVRVDKPEGRVLENDYDTERRVTEQRTTAGTDNALVRTATFIYSQTENPDGTLDGTTTIQDALHTVGTPRETVYTYDDSLITQIVDAENQAISQDWYFPGDSSPGAYPRSLKFRIDKRGLRTDYIYDAAGNLDTVTRTGDITGDGVSDTAVTRYQHNSLNLPTEIEDPVGNLTRIFYENTDYPYLPTRIEKRTPADLIRQDVLSYEAVVDGTSYATSPPATPGTRGGYGLLKQRKRAEGSADEAVTTWTHDDCGLITGKTSPTGTSDPDITLGMVHNLRGELESVTDAAGRTTSYAYDALGNRIWEERQDASGNLIWWNYQYFNSNGDLEWIDGPSYFSATSGAEDYLWRKYDGMGRLTENIQWRSVAREDGSGVQQPIGEALYATTLREYNAFGDLLEVRNPRLNLTRMAYDKIGRMTDRWSYDGATDGDPLLAHEQFTYEPGDKVATHTNPKGGVTTTLYTDTGKPRQQTNPDGTVLEWRYLLDGRVERKPVNHFNYWEFSYDDLNRTVTKTLKTTSGATLATEVCVYDRRGNLIEKTDVEGHVFTTTYDDLDRIKTETGPGATASAAQQSTTYTYDAAGEELITVNALNEQTITQYDAIGREISVAVYDSPGGNLIRQTTTSYSPEHTSRTVTEGTGGNAIATTRHFDTFGNKILTVHADDTFVRRVFGATGNLGQVTDELGRTTTHTYDGLDRRRFTTLPGGAQIEKRYDPGSNLTHRIMPGDLTWFAQYDTANRMTLQELRDASGGSYNATRSMDYTYYPSGQSTGLLETVTDDRGIVTTTSYDDFLRVEEVAADGPDAEDDVTSSYLYDNRGLVEQITESGNGATTVIDNGYSPYGQMESQSVTLNAQPHSSFTQKWDAAGRLDILDGGNSALTGDDYDFRYRADGLMDQVTVNGSNYVFDYADNGLMTIRTNPFRTVTIPTRDNRGRIEQRQVGVGATPYLVEDINWRSDSTQDDYTATRTGTGSWNETRDYTYNVRGQLTTETYAPASGQSATLDYQFDGGSITGIGVRTQAAVTGGFNVTATTVNGFARTTDESTNNEPKFFTATGTAFGAESVDVDIENTAVRGVQHPGWFDATGDWSVDLTLPPGNFDLTATAHHPSGSFSPAETNNFTVAATTEDITTTFDEVGNTITRTFSVSGRVQTLTWDGKGRLIQVEERNASSDGYDWTATYDGLNRRLATTYQKIVANTANGPLLTAHSSFDPEVEFLEISVSSYSSLASSPSTTSWKVYGPDSNGIYGGLQGIGGLEAVIEEGGTTTGVVSDAYGHVVARSDGSSLTWSDTRSLGYGVQAGTWSPSLLHADSLVLAVSWRGKYLDPTGLVYKGARYYEPNSGRFISPDPLGHLASMDLYCYANGDPVNFVDPDGRVVQEFLDKIFLHPELNAEAELHQFREQNPNIEFAIPAEPFSTAQYLAIAGGTIGGGAVVANGGVTPTINAIRGVTFNRAGQATLTRVTAQARGLPGTPFVNQFAAGQPIRASLTQGLVRLQTSAIGNFVANNGAQISTGIATGSLGLGFLNENNNLGFPSTPIGDPTFMTGIPVLDTSANLFSVGEGLASFLRSTGTESSPLGKK